ncbi:MAG TPA: four helix bundle protein [Thermoanaerobaculia bacterium]|jgi:four helix bundle protein
MANHHNSEVWKRAIELSLEVYRVTVRFPDEELFGLTAQMRSASIRAASKVAEAAFGEARDALIELETMIIVAARLEYLEKPAARRIYRLVRAALKSLAVATPDRISSGTA